MEKIRRSSRRMTRKVFCDTKIISLKQYIAVVIAVRNHLFPFRTEKLSSPAQMVLPHQVGEYVAAVL